LTVWRKGGPVFFDVEVTPNPAKSIDHPVIEGWPDVVTTRAGEALRAISDPQPFLLIHPISTQDQNSTSYSYDQ
jgi:hypothetical protein